jgi:hypothetical protein
MLPVAADTPGLITVNGAVLLPIPDTMTCTVAKKLPFDEPSGSDTTIAVLLQLLTVALVPLNVTVPAVLPKFAPVIVTNTPAEPDDGNTPVMPGAEPTTKTTPLLATPLTLTTTFPVVAPFGTGTLTEVPLQQVPHGVARTPLNVTVLVP